MTLLHKKRFLNIHWFANRLHNYNPLER